MCRRFLQVQEGGRPYIVLKWAQSADGFIAPADGSRQQLSNAFSQTLVHRWRTEESAIMVGFRTALADNPQLSARLWVGPQPLRIALDRDLQLPPTHHLLDCSMPTWLINAREDAAGISQRVRLPFDERLLPQLLERLMEAGMNSLFIEGGPALLQSFIDAGLWDEARVFTAPLSLGNGIAAPRLLDASALWHTGVGNDTLHFYRRLDGLFSYPAGAVL